MTKGWYAAGSVFRPAEIRDREFFTGRQLLAAMEAPRTKRGEAAREKRDPACSKAAAGRRGGGDGEVSDATTLLNINLPLAESGGLAEC